MTEITREDMIKAEGDPNKIPAVEQALAEVEAERNTGDDPFHAVFDDYVMLPVEKVEDEPVKIYKPTLSHRGHMKALVQKFGDMVASIQVLAYVLSKSPEECRRAFPMVYDRERAVFDYDLTSIWHEACTFCSQFEDITLVNAVGTLMGWEDEKSESDTEEKKMK